METNTTPTPGTGTPASGAVGTSTGEPIAAPGQQQLSLTQPAAAAPPAAPAPAVPAATGGKRVTMEESDFKDRIARAKRQALIDIHGTDDADAIRAKLAKADTLEKDADERKRAQMSEVERLQHDLARERQRAVAAATEARALREHQEIREQQTVIENIASRHVAPKYVGMASRELREHLRSLDSKVVDGWTDREIAKWFQTFATKQPEIAASASQRQRQRAPVGATTPTPRPATNQSTPTSSAGTNGGKTFRPGQPNSMTRAEAREAARKQGFTW